MFERFTDRARRAVVLAGEEAKLLDHPYIAAEHILLGLLHEHEGIAGQALASLGIRLERTRDQVLYLLGRGDVPVGDKHLGFTIEAKRSLEYSLKEAVALGVNFIGTEHMLLGLLRVGDETLLSVLEAVHVDSQRIRAEVLKTLKGDAVE